jgi:hypothetical protein
VSARFNSSAGPGGTAIDEQSLKPSAMRGSEPLYGYLVALELVLVSILNLTVTHGKGAPAHPSTGLSTVGLVASLLLVALVRIRHRLIVPFAAIVAAFFVTTLPKVPNSLSVAHLLGLVIAAVYAFVLTQRQRKAAAALTKKGGAAAAKSPAAKPSTERRPDSANRRRGRQQAVPAGPAASRRYTPPKPKRARPPAPPPTDEGRKWWGRRAGPADS